MVQLIPMNEEDFERWLERFIPQYGQEHVKTGRWAEIEATRLAKEEIEQALPEGRLTKDHYFYELVIEGAEQAVGMLWFGVRRRPSGKRSAYIFNIEIDEAFRQRGYASAAFLQLEEKARELEVDEIALQVFGHNEAARALYTKMGYEITNIYMAKPLHSGTTF